jgi:uncharacterized protein YegL
MSSRQSYWNSGYGGTPSRYPYNTGDGREQRIPSGIIFDPIHLSRCKEEHEAGERAVDPQNIFPSFDHLDDGHNAEASEAAYKSRTGIQGHCLPLLDVDIDVEVESNIARTKVTQTFTNPSNYSIERANYSFPLYDGSAVIAFKCYIGEDKLLEGVVKTKEVARNEFKEAIANHNVAALLEEHTPEIFETSLGNIPSRTSVKVEITYVNELKVDIGGEGVLVILPTSIAPRYGVAPLQLSASSATDGNGLHITIHIHAMVPLRKLESRTHPISVEMGTIGGKSPIAVPSFEDLVDDDPVDEPGIVFDPKKAIATLAQRDATLGSDFVLLILSSGDSILSSGAKLEESPLIDGQSAMRLTLNPRDLFSSSVEPNTFNGEIIFVADRSESMEGAKMELVKKALDFFLKSLTGKMHFNIYSFGSRFTSIWPQSQIHNVKNVTMAAEAISRFAADMGGTEILAPLQEAVRSRIVEKGFTTQIILLTDGEVWDEPAIRKFVQDTRSELKNAVRFFAFGIGNAVSHRLVEGIGTEGGGFAEVMAADTQGRWEGRLERMLKGALMPQSYDCEIEFNGISTRAAASSADGSELIQAPYTIPLLHPFSQITIYFLIDRNYGKGISAVTVKTSTPLRRKISVEVPLVKTTTSTYTAHHLAAKAIIRDLETGNSQLHSTSDNGQRADTDAKILGERLAIRYHISSKWTSFVAVDKRRSEENPGRQYKAIQRELAILNKSSVAPIASVQGAALMRVAQSVRSNRSDCVHDSPSTPPNYGYDSPTPPPAANQYLGPIYRRSERRLPFENSVLNCPPPPAGQPPPPLVFSGYPSCPPPPPPTGHQNARTSGIPLMDKFVASDDELCEPRGARRPASPSLSDVRSLGDVRVAATEAPATYEESSSKISSETKDKNGCNGKKVVTLSILVNMQSENGSFNFPPDFLEALCQYFSDDVLEALRELLLEDQKAKLGDTVEILLHTLLAIKSIRGLGWLVYKARGELSITEAVLGGERSIRKAWRWVGDVLGDRVLESRLYGHCRHKWKRPARRRGQSERQLH